VFFARLLRMCMGGVGRRPVSQALHASPNSLPQRPREPRRHSHPHSAFLPNSGYSQLSVRSALSICAVAASMSARLPLVAALKISSAA
jgi:hypothetical protein